MVCPHRRKRVVIISLIGEARCSCQLSRRSRRCTQKWLAQFISSPPFRSLAPRGMSFTLRIIFARRRTRCIINYLQRLELEEQVTHLPNRSAGFTNSTRRSVRYLSCVDWGRRFCSRPMTSANYRDRLVVLSKRPNLSRVFIAGRPNVGQADTEGGRDTPKQSCIFSVSSDTQHHIFKNYRLRLALQYPRTSSS